MPSLLPQNNPQQGSIATAQITIIDQNDGISADVSIANFNVLTNVAGVAFSNSFDNLNGIFFLRSGNIDITNIGSVVLSSNSVNMTVELNIADHTPVAGQLKGYFRVIALSADNGYTDIIASYRGETFIKRIYATKLKTETGGNTTTTFASTSGFYNLAWTSSFQQAAALLEINVEGYGLVEVAVEGHHQSDAVLAGQVQAYRTAINPGWINIGSEVVSVDRSSAFVGRRELRIGPLTSTAIIVAGEPQLVPFRFLVRKTQGAGNPEWLAAYPQTFAAYWRAN
jgi:hypothetical protein